MRIGPQDEKVDVKQTKLFANASVSIKKSLKKDKHVVSIGILRYFMRYIKNVHDFSW